MRTYLLGLLLFLGLLTQADGAPRPEDLMKGPWMVEICVIGAWSGATCAHLNKAPWLTIQYTAPNNSSTVIYDEKIDPLLARQMFTYALVAVREFGSARPSVVTDGVMVKLCLSAAGSTAKVEFGGPANAEETGPGLRELFGLLHDIAPSSSWPGHPRSNKSLERP